MSLESSLYKQLQTYPDTHIIIAYSGGIDSQVLLHALACLTSQQSSKYSLANNISVCHVNHGISDNAAQWESFAQQQCKLRNVSIDVCRVNVQAKAQHSLEQLARDARYNAIKQLIEGKPHNKVIVVTGHHKDDQAETFLLALKRGSGLKGLSSMKKALSLTEKVTLVRPLLEVTRHQIEAYAQDHALEWIEDESNDDIRFDRNFLRHTVLPALTERWPSFLTTATRSAEHCQEAEQLLTELAEQDIQHSQLSKTKLSLNTLITLSQARFNNAIRYFLKENNCLMPSSAQLSQLYVQLLAEEDKTPQIKVGDHWLRRFKHGLYLTHDLQDITEFQQAVNLYSPQTNEQQVILPDNLGSLLFTQYNIQQYSTQLYNNQQCSSQQPEQQHNEKERLNSAHAKLLKVQLPTPEQSVTVQFVHNNPKCIPDYRQHSRVLKKVLQELDIPPWERKRVPFLYYDGELVAVLGYFVCKGFIPEEQQPYSEVIWLK